MRLQRINEPPVDHDVSLFGPKVQNSNVGHSHQEGASVAVSIAEHLT